MERVSGKERDDSHDPPTRHSGSGREDPRKGFRGNLGVFQKGKLKEERLDARSISRGLRITPEAYRVPENSASGVQ